MPTKAISQMNIRINSQVKDAGDRVLVEGGVSPTQIVRALWEKISHGVQDLRQVEQVLGTSAQVDQAQESKTDRMYAMRRGRALFAEGLAEWGISADDVAPFQDASDVDRYTEALVERMKERNVW